MTKLLRCVAAAALTTIGLVVPVMVAVTVSVAVTVWLPAVFSVTLKAFPRNIVTVN